MASRGPFVASIEGNRATRNAIEVPFRLPIADTVVQGTGLSNASMSNTGLSNSSLSHAGLSNSGGAPPVAEGGGLRRELSISSGLQSLLQARRHLPRRHLPRRHLPKGRILL